MRHRAFGRTGVEVPEIGFGAWAIGSGGPGLVGYGPTDDAASLAALHRAVELGCAFIDTASVYGRGHSEELIGRAGIRDRIFLATKCGFDWSAAETHVSNWSPEFLRRSIDDSLRRLRTDRVDLLQLHNPKPGDMAALEVLEEARRAGKTRFIGVSVIKPEEAVAAIERGVDAVQMKYNYVEQEHRTRTFPAAAAKGVAVVVREPLERGLLSGKFKRDARFGPLDVRSNWKPEVFSKKMDAVEEFLTLVKPGLAPARAAIKFALASPEVSVVIPGAKTAAQVGENAGASDGKYRLVGDVFENEDVEAGFGGDA
jgi:aryl-alcohol dehydrogenase-like predicted oxidoreductase